MASNSSCALNDRLCVVREHDQAVIIVPTLLLFAVLVTLVPMFIMRYCPACKRTRAVAPQRPAHRHAPRNNHRRYLQGVDAPAGIDPLEHEELPMTTQHIQQNRKPAVAAVPPAPTERQSGAFSQVAALPQTFSIAPNHTVSVCRARMEGRPVVLRVLRESASSQERRHFLGFASFLSELGPHPFLPALLGVVSAQPPITVVLEELQHRDLLGFLWRCRQDNSGDHSCDMTEKRIFTMAEQVVCALEFLHSRNCTHGNVGARSVLVGGDLVAKLWGLGPAYRRKTGATAAGEVEVAELKKWQAPEVLARQSVSPSSDIWSCGILLYEMITLGDPPFAQLMATELLQYLQRAKTLKRPANCSPALFSIIRWCCDWSPARRPPAALLGRKLGAAARSANGSSVIRVPEPLDIGRYLREAGYGEAYNYAVL